MRLFCILFGWHSWGAAFIERPVFGQWLVSVYWRCHHCSEVRHELGDIVEPQP